MIGKIGQDATEYLIILAVIIVVALVVANVMGWFPGLGLTITQQQSKAYWQSTSPLALVDWEVSSSTGSFVVRNQTADRIEVEEISLDGTAVAITDVNITAGNRATVSGIGACTTGQPYTYNVIVTYTVDGGLANAKQTGSKPLVGICS